MIKEMSGNTNTSKNMEGQDRVELIELLKRNPDIFNRHPELIELVNFSDDRNIASLIERQVQVLRKRIKKLQLQYTDLLTVARENESIYDNLATVFSDLITYTTLADFASKLPRTLKSTFAVDAVTFKTPESIANAQQEESYQAAVARMSSNRVICDNKLPRHIVQFFFARNIASVALIPMITNKKDSMTGILALGSEQAQRFTPDLATDHLARLGLMAGICLVHIRGKCVA